MKVKELFHVISPYQEIQIGYNLEERPLTNRTCWFHGDDELSKYENSNIFQLIPMAQEREQPFLVVLIYREVISK